MSGKTNFDASKLSINEFKFIKGQVETPEDFSIEKIDSYELENSLQIGFNIEDKLVKTDFVLEIKTQSKGANSKEATGSFHLVYIFHVENLDELAVENARNEIDVDPSLANALSSITYSTSRGIFLTRLQGTALQNFILPIINPNILLHK